MIKLVATDIDGTLFQSGEREVSEAVFVQIDRLLKKVILFAAASGRQYIKETTDAAQPRRSACKADSCQ